MTSAWLWNTPLAATQGQIGACARDYLCRGDGRRSAQRCWRTGGGSVIAVPTSVGYGASLEEWQRYWEC